MNILLCLLYMFYIYICFIYLLHIQIFNLPVMSLSDFDGLIISRYLYWSDWGDVPHIGRIGMDGTNRHVIIQDKITWPNGLTLDFINDRIYWADAREDYIAFASLDGTNRHIGE